LRSLHGECRAAAAASQAAHDEIERQLDAGESLSVEAFGDWEPTVPKGMVGLKFVSRAGVFYRLMPEADYPNRRVALFRGTGDLRVKCSIHVLAVCDDRQTCWPANDWQRTMDRISLSSNLIHGSVQREVPALTRADHVCCADKTGVVRTNNVAKLKGIFQIGNGQPNEAFLPVSPPAVGVAR
jgi:hypothetical protein